MKTSTEMQKALDAKGIKKENLLYLPISKVHLDRIIAGTKKVEFRDLSDFYYNKLAKIIDGKEVLKPITHVLFQAGYSLNVPRAIVELTDWRSIFYFDENGEKVDRSNISLTGSMILEEGYKEGFAEEDEYIGIVLGAVIFKENYS